MEAILITQIIYTQLTNESYISLQNLMRNNNPIGEMKKISEQQVTSIIGQPQNCQKTSTITKKCEWIEKNRKIKIIYNTRDNTIMRWEGRGF